MNQKSHLQLLKIRQSWDESGQKKDRMVAVRFVVDGKPLEESLYDEIANEIAERLELVKHDALLEIGCGNGLLLERLEGFVQSITGVDFSIEMLKQIKSSQIKAKCLQSGANQLPYRDCSYNKIVCHSVFHYFPDLDYARQVVCEMLRICKPGGKILISDIPNGYLETLYLLESRRNMGFTKRALRTIKKWIRFAFFKLKREPFIELQPLFISPLFFKELLRNTGVKFYPLLETIAAKPETHLIYRYDVLIEK